MSYLKFYQNERYKFPVAKQVHTSDKGAEIIIEKLRRHYKLRKYRKITIKFRNSRGGGTCYYCERKIILSHNPSLLLIAHEFAHLLNYEKGKSHYHTKQLMISIKRILNYCFKKECWVQEISRRC